jgi:F0F1-type ATP synthase assembly protein I
MAVEGDPTVRVFLFHVAVTVMAVPNVPAPAIARDKCQEVQVLRGEAVGVLHPRASAEGKGGEPPCPHGLELIASIAVGFYVGRWVDSRWFGSHGWATLVGFLLGVIAGFRAVWQANRRALHRLEAIEQEERDRERERRGRDDARR